MLHYTTSIRLFDSADGFNTKLLERLHIDFAKKAYQSSNKWDYTSQMTTWLHRQDTIHLKESFLAWRRNQNCHPDNIVPHNFDCCSSDGLSNDSDNSDGKTPVINSSDSY